jgi:hypothetical protein
MSKSIAVSDSLYERAAQIAAKENLSVEEFVSAVIANRITAHEQIDARAGLFTREEFDHALSIIPDADPDPSDRL